MIATQPRPGAQKGLETPVRNRYFYGKLLDVYHFQLETGYLNGQRRLLNRLVTGYGVACGLSVEPGPDAWEVVVQPGAAIDKWGREIVVPQATEPLAIPRDLVAQAGGHKSPYGGDDPTERVVRLLLCFHECECDPTPVLGGECGTVEECAAGAIRERYCLTWKEGPAPPMHPECRLHDLLHGDRLDYQALARWVSDPCPEPAADPCIPLANVRLPNDGTEGHRCDPDLIDISVRPIVYTNDLLFEIILSLLAEERGDSNRRTK